MNISFINDNSQFLEVTGLLLLALLIVHYNIFYERKK